jgi:hypothetical protein
MWCPQQSCIRKKSVPAGFVGPLSSSHECYNPFTGKVLPITTWGSKQPESKRQTLIDLEYTRGFCTSSLDFQALPPGYEDELYCPYQYCVRRLSMPKGWVGPARANHECYNKKRNSSVPVTTWGYRDGNKAKTLLDAQCFSTFACVSDGSLPSAYNVTCNTDESDSSSSFFSFSGGSSGAARDFFLVLAIVSGFLCWVGVIGIGVRVCHQKVKSRKLSGELLLNAPEKGYSSVIGTSSATADNV